MCIPMITKNTSLYRALLHLSENSNKKSHAGLLTSNQGLLYDVLHVFFYFYCSCFVNFSSDSSSEYKATMS